MPKVVDVEQRRTELTDAAARVIAKSGIEAATMRHVAAEAGWTTGALTHYFSDKHELLLSTFEASLAGRLAQRPASTTVDARTRLRAALQGALPLDTDRRRHWMVSIAFCSHAPADDQLAATQQAAYREYRAYVADLVDEAGLSADDPVMVAERLIAAANGIAIQALFDTEIWSPQRQCAQLNELLRSVLPDLCASGANGVSPCGSAIRYAGGVELLADDHEPEIV